MSNRVLFVDDEQSLLNGIERRLGASFVLTTASSGADALALMESSEPFAVIVTDMRMPKMDGVQLIKEARLRSPDSVYVMLTGNQDQATAIQALNEGHVFRFLTKPCQSAELIKAVEGGLRQYQLVTSEKELLQNTFCGAVSVMTDVLELSHPHIFDRTERIQEIVRSLQTSLGVEDAWEFKLASRLALLGFAILPDESRGIMNVGDQSTLVDERFRAAADTGRKLIERIPRLSTVARIIGMQPDVDGSAVIPSPKSEETKAVMGATLLRVAVQWDCIAQQGWGQAQAIAELKHSLPRISSEMLQALSELPCEDQMGDEVELVCADLEEGMVLAEDIVSTNGNMLIRKGRRLNWTIIERLRQEQGTGEGLAIVKILASSVRNLRQGLLV
jgi:CheY-like chemotaxis protein